MTRRHLSIAWKNVLHTRRQALAISLLSLCAMTLALVGSFLGQGLQKALTAAVEPFDMLAGYGGSYQMVLNTVFLQDYPAGSIPHRLVAELNADPRIERAIPLAFGDNHQGYRIVGTDAELFSHRARNGDSAPWLRFAQGGPFSPGGHEAVVGQRAAAELGLTIGDRIVSTHGFARGGDEHAPYIVGGILAECGGPYDRAIFVDLRSVWESHGIHSHGDDDDHDHDHKAGDEELPDTGSLRVTAIMVKPAGLAEAYQIFTEFGGRQDADMVFPSQVVVGMLSILGRADWLLQTLGRAAGAVAALCIALSLYWSAMSRRREAGILQLLGAERRDIFAILAWEGILTTGPGLVTGCALGHGILALLSGLLSRETSLSIATGVSWQDPVFAFCLIVAGVLGQVFAAMQLTRQKH